MFQMRCSKCNALLAEESIRDGTIQIKCHKCKSFNKIERLVVNSKLDSGNIGQYTESDRQSETA